MPTLGIICAALVVIMYVPTISKGPINLRDGKAFYEPFPWTHEVAAPAVTGGVPVAPTSGTVPPKRKLTMQELNAQMKAKIAADEAASAKDTDPK